MDLSHLDRIKELAIAGMFSDQELTNFFVLKGGNALDIVYKIAGRASQDLDFSIETEFKKDDLEHIQTRIDKALSNTFSEAGYTVFDVKLSEKPKRISQEIADFWGGYRIDFKIIEAKRFSQFANDVNALRRNAKVLSETHQRTFVIEISKFEHCKPSQKKLLKGYTIQVYTPEMIVCEKLRAICQQMPEYASKVKMHQRARARDFFDIYSVFDNFKINFNSPENKRLITDIFAAKRVPLKLLGLIRRDREFHRPDFVAVENTVKADTNLQNFDFYFDFVVDKCEQLKTLWKK